MSIWQRKSLWFTHFSPKRLNPNLHPAEGGPFLAQILQRGADRIDRVVDAEEAVAQDRATSKNLEKCIFLDGIFGEKCIFADEK